MAPTTLDRSSHPISRRFIDPDALRILYRLHHAGYTSYLVGGSVRDLLIGRTPKDFDIGTNAHPAQIRRLFRNSRIIGRRFRLVHVFFRDKIVEVSTFRGLSAIPDEEAGEGAALPEPEPPQPGRRRAPPLHENLFGTPAEDAHRRDFTVNGLFYDIGTFSVIDFVGGLEDLQARTLRTIGDPATRFIEDPVRMVRAVEFAARLGFDVEPATWEAIVENHKEILRGAAARLLEEMLELLRRGAARRSFELLGTSGLLGDLIPELASVVCYEDHAFWKLLAAADRRRAEGRVLSDGLLLTLLFWPLLDAEDAAAGAALSAGDRLLALERIMPAIALRIAVPAQLVYRIKQSLLSLPKVERGPHAARAWKQLVRKPYFADTLELLDLLAEAGVAPADEARQWRELLAEEPLPPPDEMPARRPRRRSPRPARPEDGLPDDSPAATEPDTALATAAEPGGEEARRRRRRRGGRRKRAGGGGSPAGGGGGDTAQDGPAAEPALEPAGAPRE